MNGPDPAGFLETLMRRLRKIRPPTPTVGFRNRAWRDFERALDPLGDPKRRFNSRRV